MTAPRRILTTKRFVWQLGASLCLLLWLLFAAFDSANALNSVLDLNGTFPYLINKTTGLVIEPRDYMDFDNIYTPNEQYKRHQTAQSRLYHLLKAFDFANYYQSDYWHYSNEEDLLKSAWPVANADRCARELDWLDGQLNNSEHLFDHGLQHTNLMQLVDSFGRPEADTFLGHGHWLGSYYECTRNVIDMKQFEYEQRCSGLASNEAPCNQTENSPSRSQAQIMKTRYCIGKASFTEWPTKQQDDYVPTISIKWGLCLPESCETLSISRHKAQIERLMLFQAPGYLKSRLRLNDMYCLPDARSPVRDFSLATRIYLSICATWLVTLVLATMAYSTYKRHRNDIKTILRQTRAAECCHHLNAADAHQHQQLQQEPDIAFQLSDRCDQRVDSNGKHHHEANTKLDDQEQNTPKAKFINYMVCGQNSPAGDGQEPAKSVGQLLLITTQATLGPAGSLLTGAGSSPISPDVANQACCDERNQTSNSSNSMRSSCSTSSSLASLSAWLQESPLLVRILQALSIKENVIEFQRPPMLLRDSDTNRRLRINLNALDSIKCLCCVLVILGHIVFIHMQHLKNITKAIEVSNELMPRFLIAFFNFVDTFFIISGMLTAYFVFKRFNKHNFSHPLQWAQVSLLRLLRLSPVYVLVFWFVKTTTVHLSEGPLWDYGTDKNSNKGLCINDHWWKSLLYLGNWGTMQPLCILPAWSIIVDAQYSLVVPPILYLILKYKRIGYASLLAAIVVSTANMSHQLATQTAVKTSDMAKVRLHVYPLISRFAAEFYNTAWNRVGSVAIGILGGHLLYLYDIKAIRRWPWFMRGSPFKFVLFMHLLIFVLPSIGRFTNDPTEASGESNMTIFVLSNATIKPVWSLINTIFLLRLITDLRFGSIIARLMSHNIWHCLGKLCFTSYLIHYEIIMVLLKSRPDNLVEPCWTSVLREFSLAFLVSTAISYCVHILFEAPINRLISLALVKQSHTKSQRSNNNDANTAGLVAAHDGQPIEGDEKCYNKNNGDDMARLTLQAPLKDTRDGIAYTVIEDEPESRQTSVGLDLFVGGGDDELSRSHTSINNNSNN